MRKQRGVTMIGWIILLIPVALVLYAGIRVGPLYYEYFKLVSACEKTATELKSDETLTKKTIQNALQRRFDTSYLDDVKVDDLDITKNDAGWVIGISYDEEAPMFGNFLLLLRFDKSIPVY